MIFPGKVGGSGIWWCNVVRGSYIAPRGRGAMAPELPPSPLHPPRPATSLDPNGSIPKWEKGFGTLLQWKARLNWTLSLGGSTALIMMGIKVLSQKVEMCWLIWVASTVWETSTREWLVLWAPYAVTYSAE